MRTTIGVTLARIGLGSFAAALLVAAPLQAATATALVTVRVLGHAGADAAQGAVTISKVAENGFGHIEPARNAGAPVRSERTISSFRVGGAQNGTFAVSLPEAVTVHSGDAQLPVTVFRAPASSGRLTSAGLGSAAVAASVSIPAGQPSGEYVGSYPVTIAYD